MTFGMRVRLWARQAPRSHLVGTAVVTIMLAGLLAVASVPRDRGTAKGSDVLAAAGAGSDGGATAGQIAGTAGSAAGATALTVPGGASATTAAPGSFPGSTSGSSGGGAAAQTPAQRAAAQQQPLTASDVGVTPTTIKIGFLIAQVGGLDGAGFALGLRTDIEQVIKAYVDDINARGGIHGRKVIYVTTKVDPLSASNQRAACLKMTEDEKVFAVLDSASTLGSAELCYGAEHHVPYYNTGLSTVSESYVQRSFPYQVSVSQSGTRQVINWARYVGNDGLFKGQKLGVLSDECAPAPEIMDKALKPTLAEFGVKPVEVRLSCDANTAQQQIPNAVLQMRRAGVTLVFPATIFTNVQVFLQNADAQQWHPKYSASDFYGMSVDLFAKNFPPGQWEGTRAVTTSHAGEPQAGKPFPPASQQCNKVLEKASLRPNQNYDGDAEAIVHCDSVHLFERAAIDAGANLTRRGWADAVQRIGDFPSALTAKAIFRPGKTTGGDSLALIEWHSNCKCNTQIRPHDRPAYA